MGNDVIIRKVINSNHLFSAEVMHDRPAPMFQPLNVKDKHKVGNA